MRQEWHHHGKRSGGAVSKKKKASMRSTHPLKREGCGARRKVNGNKGVRRAYMRWARNGAISTT
jgi:hypothetical protein